MADNKKFCLLSGNTTCTTYKRAGYGYITGARKCPVCCLKWTDSVSEQHTNNPAQLAHFAIFV